MVMREIVHTCSNAHVARAALASIGGGFARDVVAAARRRHIPAGVLVANIVRDFSRRAADEEWKAADEAARGADQPILSGLRFILQSRLSEASQDLAATHSQFASREVLAATRRGVRKTKISKRCLSFAEAH